MKRLMVLSELFGVWDWLKFFTYNNTYYIVIAAVTAWLFGDFMHWETLGPKTDPAPKRGVRSRHQLVTYN